MTKDLDKDRAAFLMADFSQGFIKFMGLEALAVRPGEFDSQLLVTDDHRQQDGFVHAGAISTMADHTAGYSAFSLAGEGMQILTIEFKINFLAPAAGDQLLCRARVIREGKRVMVTESKVYDINKGIEKQVTQALLTMAVVPREKLKQPQ